MAVAQNKQMCDTDKAIMPWFGPKQALQYKGKCEASINKKNFLSNCLETLSQKRAQHELGTLFTSFMFASFQNICHT